MIICVLISNFNIEETLISSPLPFVGYLPKLFLWSVSVTWRMVQFRLFFPFFFDFRILSISNIWFSVFTVKVVCQGSEFPFLNDVFFYNCKPAIIINSQPSPISFGMKHTKISYAIYHISWRKIGLPINHFKYGKSAESMNNFVEGTLWKKKSSRKVMKLGHGTVKRDVNKYQRYHLFNR